MKGKFDMKLFMRIGLAVLTAIAGFPSFSHGAAAQTHCGYDFSEVTALAQQLVDSNHLDGASLTLIKYGTVIYERYFGAYDANTIVPIASASKWLSVATLMTLVDEGKLDLYDPVSKYLDYFTGEKGAITIRQLISHTSGLPPLQKENGDLNDAPCLSVREMQSNLTAGLPVYFAPRDLTAVNYGIGEWIDILDEHGRAVVVSSPGLLGFTPWVDKDRDLIGVFMVRTQAAIYPAVGAIRRKIAEVVDDCECKRKVE